MKKEIRKFIFKIFLISSPVLILMGLYLYFDPFKALYKYENYIPANDKYAIVSPELISIKTLLNNYPKYHYDSFIFGSSRSYFYQAEDWNKYINTGINKILHFSGNGETISGIHQKINFLKENKIPIHNCLLVMDSGTFARTGNLEGILFRKHYLLSGENMLAYHFMFFKAFLDKNFLFAYLDLKLTHKYKPYMKAIQRRTTFDYNPFNNEFTNNTGEESIRQGTYYKNQKKKIFKRRHQAVPRIAEETIGTEQTKYLTRISKILMENNADYKIIISPHYDQVCLNPNDLNKLKQIFGSENVFDFSGKNWMTDDYQNFYDKGHYRPKISKEILKIIYSG